uniref:Uncharacterized protein n=1 Tax=Macaca mulatta TaxID=9544 RepID=A0A5F8AHQ2_MACMU
ASTLVALEKPFSLPLHCGSHSGLVEARAGSLCLPGGVEGQARAGTGAAPGTRGPARVPCGRGFGGARTRHRAVRGLVPGPTAAEGAPCPRSAGPPALPLNSLRASAASRRAGTRDLQPAMPEPPCTPPWASALPEPPRGALPAAPRCLVPWTAQGLRSAGAPRDWQAAQLAAPVRDPLGEASWAPESSGDMENLYV